MSLDIKKPQTSLPVKYIIKGHLWTPVILPTISTGSIHWSLWSIPWFCLISTVNPGCFEKGVFFTIPVSKKLITKTMGIHQTPTTLWVESHDGFRCIYSWLRGRVITTHLHGSEPRVFFSVPGIEPQELHTLVPKFIFQETLLGQIPCIYNYIYIWQRLLNHSDLEWLFEDFWNTPTACFVRISPRDRMNHVAEFKQAQGIHGCHCAWRRIWWGYMWWMIRHAYKSARNKCDCDHKYIYIYRHIYIYKYHLQYMDSGLIYSEWISIQFMRFGYKCLFTLTEKALMCKNMDRILFQQKKLLRTSSRVYLCSFMMFPEKTRHPTEPLSDKTEPRAPTWNPKSWKNCTLYTSHQPPSNPRKRK